MTTIPSDATGILRHTSDGTTIEFDRPIEGYESGTPVRVILWDERPMSEQPIVEQIAFAQQLDPQFIAKGLMHQGVFTTMMAEVDPSLLLTNSHVAG